MSNESDEIKRLTAIRDVAKNALNDAEVELKYERIKQAGLVIGGIVFDHNGKEFMVREIEAHNSTLWVKGSPRKQDGTFGIGRNYVYDWKLK